MALPQSSACIWGRQWQFPSFVMNISDPWWKSLWKYVVVLKEDGTGRGCNSHRPCWMKSSVGKEAGLCKCEMSHCTSGPRAEQGIEPMSRRQGWTERPEEILHSRRDTVTLWHQPLHPLRQLWPCCLSLPNGWWTRNCSGLYASKFCSWTNMDVKWSHGSLKRRNYHRERGWHHHSRKNWCRACFDSQPTALLPWNLSQSDAVGVILGIHYLCLHTRRSTHSWVCKFDFRVTGYSWTTKCLFSLLLARRVFLIVCEAFGTFKEGKAPESEFVWSYGMFSAIAELQESWVLYKRSCI